MVSITPDLTISHPGMASDAQGCYAYCLVLEDPGREPDNQVQPNEGERSTEDGKQKATPSRVLNQGERTTGRRPIDFLHGKRPTDGKSVGAEAGAAAAGAAAAAAAGAATGKDMGEAKGKIRNKGIAVLGGIVKGRGVRIRLVQRGRGAEGKSTEATDASADE
ncbi:hypothetical protein BO71DRAFT_402525 [Aspergillus ellipticus CBS 707.79]|uniref:Uncharacterized protein n=1 Tax=Aspergillus ellipticus CBS 707.79 TaxID=1448320 RepID=A0A319CYG6_9EURO|nr:hypothetical protein BO71DRAFT_402525 [Aspergillus ellipticus CBS 707.79]